VSFNTAITRQVKVLKPDVLFIYKGVFVSPATLAYARQQGCKLAMFYPDVSMTAHGENIPKAIPLYDLIFTTKTFGIRDMKEKYTVKNVSFIPHGFDPDIHRPLKITAKDRDVFGCDVSFIGIWSPKKEKLLAHLKETLPNISLKIWGGQWDKAGAEVLKSSIQGMPVVGDLYAMAIQCSKVNLGILSEQVSGASSGDLITSRTFHIPGAGGFMLHERNEESVLYYKENEEAGFFDGAIELAAKTKGYLENDALREKVRLAGHNRAMAEHSLDARAKEIIQLMNQL
jgi:spore maturation protein CgeB